MSRWIAIFALAMGQGGMAFGQDAVLADTHPLAREAFYHFLLGETLEADARLAATSRRQVSGANVASADLLRGIQYLSYGLPDDAERAFQRVVQQGAPDATGDRAWFHLARIAHRRGRTAQAQAALAKVQRPLPGETDDERRVLHAYTLIETGKPADAISLLDKLPPQSSWAAYARFNLGVALVRTGDSPRGLALLDVLGNSPVSGADLIALRDKANVALAYAKLQSGNPLAAREVLARVRLDSIVSDKALLGMGWALSASQDHERALVYWDELARRDSMHTEVQEALLAAPYALVQLGASNQALARYQEADAAYTAEQVRLDRAIEVVRDGVFVEDLLRASVDDDADWLRRVRDLPAGPATRYLVPLLATNEFQSALDDMRKLVALRDRTTQWSRKLDDMKAALAEQRSAFADRRAFTETRLPKLDPARIAHERDRLADRLATLGRAPGRDMTQLDALLVEARRRRASLHAAMTARPEALAEFAARIESLRTKAARFTNDADAVLTEQRHRIARLAIDELENRKQRLNSYRAQVRFAIAETYDRALRAPAR